MPLNPYRLRIRDVMVEDVQYVSPTDTLYDVLDAMMENGFSTLPVVDTTQKCVGMIAAVDLLAPTHHLDDGAERMVEGEQDLRAAAKSLQRSALSGHRVEDFMSHQVVAVRPELTLPQAAETMLHHQVHHLVVADEEERLLGILSTMDILEAFVQGVAAPVGDED
jgi:CBS domain-containing membrane protein